MWKMRLRKYQIHLCQLLVQCRQHHLKWMAYPRRVSVRSLVLGPSNHLLRRGSVLRDMRFKGRLPSL